MVVVVVGAAVVVLLAFVFSLGEDDGGRACREDGSVMWVDHHETIKPLEGGGSGGGGGGGGGGGARRERWERIILHGNLVLALVLVRVLTQQKMEKAMRKYYWSGWYQERTRKERANEGAPTLARSQATRRNAMLS